MGIFKYSENFLNFWELCKCDEFTKCLMCSEKFWKRNSIINLMCSGCSGCILRVPRAKRIQFGTEPTRRREVRRGRFFFVVSRRFERIGRSRCRRRCCSWFGGQTRGHPQYLLNPLRDVGCWSFCIKNFRPFGLVFI